MRGIKLMATGIVGLFLMWAGSYALHMFFYSMPIMEGSHKNAGMACIVIYFMIGIILLVVREKMIEKNKVHALYTNRPYRSEKV